MANQDAVTSSMRKAKKRSHPQMTLRPSSIPKISPKPPTIPILELKRYNIFNWLSSKNELAILENVKLAYVFQNTGLIVTTDDEVYSIGQVGGTLEQTVNLTKVPQLCGKGVKEFVAGSKEYCFALTEQGAIYSWGNNGHGQLGLGDREASLEPKIIQGEFEGKKIVQIAASTSFALALDNDGGVYGWGYPRLSPCIIHKEHFVTHKITSLAVSQKFAVGLCEDGQLLKWDTPSGSGPPQIIPVHAIFKKIVSGDCFVWALTNNGDGYFINESTQYTKAKLGHYVLDFASDHKFGMSAIEHYHGIVCNGGFGGDYRKLVHSTDFTSLDQVFAARAQITYRTLTAPKDKPHTELGTGRSAIDDIARAWDNERMKDVTFVVEDKTIRANKTILSLRSDYFEKMFCGHMGIWKESLKNSGSVVIHDTKYDAFFSLLYYIYHDQLDASCTDYEKICDVLKLADSYCELGLRNVCETILLRKITTESALHLLKFASLANATALEQRVFQYVVSHRKEIMKLCPNPGDLENKIGKEAYDKLMLALMQC